MDCWFGCVFWSLLMVFKSKQNSVLHWKVIDNKTMTKMYFSCCCCSCCCCFHFLKAKECCCVQMCEKCRTTFTEFYSKKFPFLYCFSFFLSFLLLLLESRGLNCMKSPTKSPTKSQARQAGIQALKHLMYKHRAYNRQTQYFKYLHWKHNKCLAKQKRKKNKEKKDERKS